MENKHTVGVLGGYGLTGQVVAQELSNDENITLLVGGRNKNKIDDLCKQLGDRVKPYIVDVCNQKDLSTFCRHSDVLINCTGPAHLYSEKVAFAALENNCHYISPAGGEDLFHSLASHQNEMVKKGLYYIVSCGWIPGIAEVFTHYIHSIAINNMDELDELELYYGDRNLWSETGLKDIICLALFTVGRNNAGPGYYKNGKWKSMIRGAYRNVNLAHPLNKQKAYYYFPDELKKFVSKNTSYNKVSAFVMQLSLSTITKMFLISTFYRNNLTGAIQLLKNEYINDCKKNLNGGGLEVRIYGRNSNGKQTINGNFFINKPYWITGMPSVIATKMLLNDQLKTNGCNYLCDAVDNTLFMNALFKAGVECKVTLNNTAIS